MTKEAKLVAAQRIIPEWTEYDNEIKAVLKGFKENKSYTEGKQVIYLILFNIPS